GAAELTRVEGIIVEIREPGRKPRRVPVTSAVEVGRGCKGVLINDDAASRRHIVLTPGPDGLYVTDLGSSNGTYVNGAPLTGRPAAAAAGAGAEAGSRRGGDADPAARGGLRLGGRRGGRGGVAGVHGRRGRHRPRPPRGGHRPAARRPSTGMISGPAGPPTRSPSSR